jgi:hypothetical protein
VKLLFYFRIMELDTYLYGAYSREKRSGSWGKSDNNFPFFTRNVNPKDFLCCKHMKCPLWGEKGWTWVFGKEGPMDEAPGVISG